MISLDFETYLISEQEPAPKPVCLSYYREETHETGLLVGFEDMQQFLIDVINNSDCKVIAHNASFEVAVIKRWFPTVEIFKALQDDRIICTQIIQQLINCRKEPVSKVDVYREVMLDHYPNLRIKGLKYADLKSAAATKKTFQKLEIEDPRVLERCKMAASQAVNLATLVYQYFKEDISEDKKDPKAWRLRYSELDGIPLEKWPEKAKSYAIEDSVWAMRVFRKQSAVDYKLSVKAHSYLNLMGSFGIKVDTSRVETLKKELMDILTPEYEFLKSKGIVKEEGGKNMTAFRLLVTAHVDKPEKTVSGAVSTSGESLARYLANVEKDSEIYKIINSYLKVMEYEKVLTAFVSRLEGATLIRTNYKAVVSSGRTSSSTSSAYPSVNIQQMPRGVSGVTWDIRNCFVPSKENFKICAIDYAGLELASAANQLSISTGRREMLDLLNLGSEPTDMHSMFAYRVMNLKEKTAETYESFVKNKKTSPYKEYRQLCKPINLGFPGGIGYDTMRTLLARDGIHPKLVVLESSPFEDRLNWKRNKTRAMGYPTRVRRVGFKEFQLVYDELVELKQTLFGLYPDLEEFLSSTHEQFLTGKSQRVLNEWNEWEVEPMYRYETGGFVRDNCMYTQLCNGFLMQSPAAIGAKQAMVKIIDKYYDNRYINPLAFIHDEIVMEVDMESNWESIVMDVSEILIDEMHKVMKNPRITVEAELMDYWMKAGGFWSATYWKNRPGDLLRKAG